MNQANLFYFSGHGATGEGFNVGPDFQIGADSSVYGRDLIGYWNDDIIVGVLAGCSVLDINGDQGWVPNPAYYAPVFGPNVGYYPGLYMNNLGPRFFLGYGGSAPRDTQNADVIADSFATSYSSGLAAFDAWSNANHNPNGRNATALHKDTKFGHFERQTLAGLTVGYIWRERDKIEW